MSENLDLVRSILAEWQHGDFSRSDWADPDIEFVRADGPTPGSWRGRGSLAEGYRDFLGNWEDYRMRADAFREVDSERVFVLVHASGRGKASGMDLGEMWSKSAAVFRVKAGRVSKITHYFDRDRALADLGLKE